MSESNLIPPKPPQKPNPPSVVSTLVVFGIAFAVLVGLFNLPTIVSAIQYPLTHSEESDNEKLTAQYRALYGYDSQAHAQEIPQASFTPQPSVVPQAAINMVTIDKIGISAPINQVTSTDDKTILDALKTGVVLYPGSSYPGEGGTTVIVGHSSSNPPWTKYSGVFALLGKLAHDDLISVSFRGHAYLYQVRTKETGSVEQILNSGLGGDLILTSCWPIGTDQGRIVVVANLVH